MTLRVLLVRTSALGDVVHALPVLTALRRHLPAARIGWVVEAAYAPLLAGHPDLDELFPVHLRAWRRRPLDRGFRREVAAVRRFAPDLALDLMGNHKGALLARWSGAKRVAGLARRWRREPASAVWVHDEVEPRGPHAVDEALAPLAARSLAAAGVPDAALAEPADFGGDKLFAGAPPAAGGPRLPAGGFVFLHPGAGWGNKIYPPAWWGEVARRLERGTGLTTLVDAAPGEERLAGAVVTAAGGAARTVSTGGLVGLATALRRARLVLGGDTGPLHLAHALGAPVLCLLGPTDPERSGPYGAPRRALAVRLPCSFCARRFDETKACLYALPPAAVAERALGLLR